MYVHVFYHSIFTLSAMVGKTLQGKIPYVKPVCDRQILLYYAVLCIHNFCYAYLYTKR